MNNLDQLLSQVEQNDQFSGMEARINVVKETTNEVQRQQLQSVGYLRQVTQALH